jgi:hypothetical protein
MDPISLTNDYELKLFDLQKTVDQVDLTVRDLFEIIKQAESKNPGIAEALGMPNFKKFYTAMQRKETFEQKLYYIQLYWPVEYETRRQGKKLEQLLDQAELPPQMDVSGIGKHYNEEEWSQKCPEGCPDHNAYAIEFTPVNQLADLKIKVDPKIVYKNMTLTVYPSLFQVINSILYEITFVGYDPAVIEEERQELHGRVERAKDHLLTQEGTDILNDLLGPNI